VLVDDLADLQPAQPQQRLLPAVQGVQQLAQPLHRGTDTQLRDDAALPARAPTPSSRCSSRCRPGWNAPETIAPATVMSGCCSSSRRTNSSAGNVNGAASSSALCTAPPTT